jgi:phosphoribosylformylglycinamidine synthase
MSVFRVYVEKKGEFAVEARGILSDIKTTLQLSSIKSLRLINRYDVQGISSEVFEQAIPTIFSEPQVDLTYNNIDDIKSFVFGVEYLPGQFDQRADSCEQCIEILTEGNRPKVRTAKIYVIDGDLTQDEKQKIVDYIINPVESRLTKLEKIETLDTNYDVPSTVKTLDGFIDLDKAGLEEFIKDFGLAMDIDDILFCQEYFKNDEKRNPTITEIRMIDTYWSDHCRHTTFSTNIDDVIIENDYIKETFEQYKSARQTLYAHRNDKPMTLMDLATIAVKELKSKNLIHSLDESEEINACSVKIKVDVDGQKQDWLLMFKNETHNHPTEIEPFGGAATCLGGAIRDPLSGRSYVYQAMRVTGADNPLTSLKDTVKGKLPQKKITLGAASGYSSYGNQIGLATGHVAEIYHKGYVAKRLEIGAVIGAAPMENVVREVPADGDVIVLLGGKTGRDGCGGATGSSKSHTLESLENCGAEVQKGNAPEERKLQRLFRDKNVTTLIKRCNDFGAGGISVAIGELADGLIIDLDAVPKKYDGLDGTELAISESQERMAVVVEAKNADKFIELAQKENLLATKVAVVTKNPRLKMNWCNNQIVDLSREFLNSNGAVKYTDIKVNKASVSSVNKLTDTGENWKTHLSSLNICSQKGLVERFDSTIGAGSVLMPFGGAYQLTPTQSMVAKIPVLKGSTDTSSVMGWGFNPYISEQSPYHSSIYAVIESVAKIIAVSGSYKKCWLTFQEYFERTKNDPSRWGKPFSALLGAYKAQSELNLGAIGGKDSMSGSFEEIDVPPTLVSFAVSVTDAKKVVSPEFKSANNKVAIFLPEYDENKLPVWESVKAVFDKVEEIIENGDALAVWALTTGGVSEAVFKMGLGNKIGFNFKKEISDELMFNPVYGGFIVELKSEIDGIDILGTTSDKYEIKTSKNTLDCNELSKLYQDKLEPVFACTPASSDEKIEPISFNAKTSLSPAIKIARPRVVIPVFPGTNCEYDTAKVFENAGGDVEVFVIKNTRPDDIKESVLEFANLVKNSQIVMVPGGFSGGDEPEGSGKFITSFFRNPSIKEAVSDLLKSRDGLMLGICNGFQALIKLGLVPFGEIVDTDENCPTLTFNSIGRHQSMMVNTRICSNKSPWLNLSNVGDVHNVAISHGEGRFVAPKSVIDELIKNGQIATQYVDLNGNPTYDIRFNPNNSALAIEGISSPDGRVLGKMAHSERIGNNVCKNVVGNKDQLIFKAGIEYFK